MSDTAYISKNLPLSPAQAAAIADHWHGRLDEATMRSHYVRGADRLWLGAELRRVHAERSGVRQAPGILWVAGLPVPIEFEISAWSTTETTLAIRPRALVSVVGRRRYDEAAYRALQDISRCFLATREWVGTKKRPYRDRTFAWPAPPSGETSPLRPTAAAAAVGAGGGAPARVTAGAR